MPLSLSLITSFAPGGWNKCLDKWPMEAETPSVTAADLYCFMGWDFDHGSMADHLKPTAVEWLAGKWNDPGWITAEANRIHDAFSTKGITIPAFATFVPEIASTDELIWRKGLNALRCLIKLAGEINGRAGHHKVHAIEVVLGSVCGAIQIDSGSDLASFHVPKSSWKDVQQQVLNRLAMLIEELEFAEVCFAVEFEPGPLFALNTLDSIKHFVGLLEVNAPFYSNRVGLNLDIGHAILTGISPDEHEDGSLDWLLKWCSHAHVSDHERGHFSDVSVLSQAKEQIFCQWMKVLERKMKIDLSDENKTKEESFWGGQGTKFSKFIAIELEMCKRHDFVVEMVSKMKEIMRNVEKN